MLIKKECKRFFFVRKSAKQQNRKPRKRITMKLSPQVLAKLHSQCFIKHLFVSMSVKQNLFLLVFVHECLMMLNDAEYTTFKMFVTQMSNYLFVISFQLMLYKTLRYRLARALEIHKACNQSLAVPKSNVRKDPLSSIVLREFYYFMHSTFIGGFRVHLLC